MNDEIISHMTESKDIESVRFGSTVEDVDIEIKEQLLEKEIISLHVKTLLIASIGLFFFFLM